MIKRRISINKKSKDWKDKYPMVEIHWVDIVSDSNWQSLDQLSKVELPVCVTKGIDPQDRGLPFSTVVPLSVVTESRLTNNRPLLWVLMI
jgi:hypothetical protein